MSLWMGPLIKYLLLDAYPNAAFAYGLNKLKSSYAGFAVRIRRDSDDAQADIGFDNDGNFDAASAASHIGGSVGRITIWYDQSGNGRDVFQGNEINQPIYSATPTNCLEWAVQVGNPDVLAPANMATGWPDEQNKMAFAWAYQNVTTPSSYPNRNCFLIRQNQGGGNCNYSLFEQSDAVYMNWSRSGGDASVSGSITADNTTPHTVLVFANWDNDTGGLWRDGSLLSSTISNGATPLLATSPIFSQMGYRQEYGNTDSLRAKMWAMIAWQDHDDFTSTDAEAINAFISA